MARSQSRWSFRGLCHSVFSLLAVERMHHFMWTVPHWSGWKTRWRGLEFKMILANDWVQKVLGAILKAFFASLMIRAVLGLSRALSLMAELEGVKHYPQYGRSRWGPLKQIWCTQDWVWCIQASCRSWLLSLQGYSLAHLWKVIVTRRFQMSRGKSEHQTHLQEGWGGGSGVL